MSSTRQTCRSQTESEEKTMIHTLQDYIQRLQGLQDGKQDTSQTVPLVNHHGNA